MPATIRIVANQKKTNCKNPLSGHEWTEYSDPTSYSIRGPVGEVERVKTLEKAETLRAEWQAFYDKFFPCFPN